jgi:hypothetical protein
MGKASKVKLKNKKQSKSVCRYFVLLHQLKRFIFFALPFLLDQLRFLACLIKGKRIISLQK